MLPLTITVLIHLFPTFCAAFILLWGGNIFAISWTSVTVYDTLQLYSSQKDWTRSELYNSPVHVCLHVFNRSFLRWSYLQWLEHLLSACRFLFKFIKWFKYSPNWYSKLKSVHDPFWCKRLQTVWVYVTPVSYHRRHGTTRMFFLYSPITVCWSAS